MNQEGRGCVFLSIPSASHSGKHMETIYRMDQVLSAWRPGNWVKYSCMALERDSSGLAEAVTMGIRRKK